MVSFLDFSDMLIVDLMFFVFDLMIFLEVFFYFSVSQQKGLVYFFAIEMIDFFKFSEEGILILGSVDGELDLIDVVIGNFFDIHGFIGVDGKEEVLVEGLSELLSLFEDSFGGGGLKFGDWHWQS